MTTQEKREDAKMGILKQLKGRVRPHRSAPKVLEIAIALAEDLVERMRKQIAEREWEIEYMKGLNPEEIEPDEEKKS